jgi:hypothetical protein
MPSSTWADLSVKESLTSNRLKLGASITTSTSSPSAWNPPIAAAEAVANCSSEMAVVTEIDVLGGALDHAVRLHCVAAGEGEAELSDAFQGDSGQAFVEGVHGLRGGRELGEPGLPELADVLGQVKLHPD